MNALAHASESLYAPGANPVAEGAALRAAELFASGLAPGELRREDLALAALLGGYAVGTTGLSLHHALCQTIVRTAGTPHALTNAVMLPHTLRFMEDRFPEQLRKLAAALGGDDAPSAVATLAARSGATRSGRSRPRRRRRARGDRERACTSRDRRDGPAPVCGGAGRRA